MMKRSRASSARLFAFMAFGLLGCAPAAPMLHGGTTTPQGRSDLAVGGAFRVPLGELASEQTRNAFQSDAIESGAVPVARYRYGFGRRLDAGVTIFGPALAVDGRYELWVDEDDTLRPALSIGANSYFGLFSGGHRTGGGLSSLLTLSATSLLEIWLGPTVAFHGVATGADDGDVSAWGMAAGGVVGLGAGFRNFHVLMELAVAYEHWSGSSNAGDLQANGVSLTPAFALRFRI